MMSVMTGIPVHENGAQDSLPEESPAPASLPSVIGRLPPALQASVARIAAAGRGPYGHTSIQIIFDLNLAIFEDIYRIGAEHADVCVLLYEIGIRRKDGARLNIGTVSSAVCRARIKAAAGRRNSKSGTKKTNRSRPARIEPTGEGRRTQIARSLLEEPQYETALSPSPTPEAPHFAIQRGSPYIPSSAPATSVDAENSHDIGRAASAPSTTQPPSPVARGSPANGNLANVRNAGDLLNKIRDNHD